MAGLPRSRARARPAREESEAAGPPSGGVARDELVAARVHDLRNPLNIVLTWTHLLASGALDAEGAAKALASIREQVELQARILADVSEYSSLAAGAPTLERRELDLGELARGVVEALQPIARARFVRLEAVPADDMRVDGDEARLTRLVRALVERAVAATRAAGRVKVSWRERDGEATLEVAADGGGFSAAERARYFAPVGPSDRTRGTGNLHLELAIAEQVARAHGGKLEASSPGEEAGSKFELSIPLA
jgi:signal transduction histidine kinase